MNTLNTSTLVMIPMEELNDLKMTQQEILQQLKALSIGKASPTLSKHVTAKEFMEAVKVCRSKFDQLVTENKIKIIKKRRKIYVPASEIDRYFNDPSIV